MPGGHSPRNRARTRRKAGLILFGLVLVLVFLDLQLRPVIQAMAAYQAKSYTVRIMNEAFAGELGVDQYNNLVRVTQNGQGEITSIMIDMMEANRLKIRVTQSILDELSNLERSEIMVPVGTMLGNQYTSGRGPLIKIQVIPLGYVESNIYNHFSSAGINQTLHRVMLEQTVQIAAVIPGYSVQTEATASICIGETVIVGKVPDFYTQIEGAGESWLRDHNDYGNGSLRPDT